MIADATPWFDYHRARNESSRTYNESKADEVAELAEAFAADARALLVAAARRRARLTSTWRFAGRPLKLLEVARIREAMSDSDLPMFVDVADWHSLRPSFREQILSEGEVLQEAPRDTT